MQQVKSFLLNQSCNSYQVYNTGTYCCEILPGPENGPHVSTLQTNVTVWATADDLDVKANPVEVIFVPAVFVEQEINLDETHKADLQIYGLNQVLDQVTVSRFYLQCYCCKYISRHLIIDR